MTENYYIEQLRQEVEHKVGRKIKTPKDFELLRDVIYEECHTMLSISTLKRIWGYVQTDSSPRSSSLEPLVAFVGYDDWDAFVAAQSTPDNTERPRRRNNIFYALAALLTIIIATACYFTFSEKDVVKKTFQQANSTKRVLHKGQDCFRDTEDYLRLFGIASSDTNYFRPVPGMQNVYVWGPEYHHPVWHNEGDSSQLLPTITEYWTPLPGEKAYHTKEYVKEVNSKLYYERSVKDEIRITFMKYLVDGFYVFLGIYCMDREHSTEEHFVWKRIADDCDLGKLQQLNELHSM